MFLQKKDFRLRNKKQSEETLFHMPSKPTGEDPKKIAKELPKGVPKPFSGPSEDASKRPPKPIPSKINF